MAQGVQSIMFREPAASKTSALPGEIQTGKGFGVEHRPTSAHPQNSGAGNLGSIGNVLSYSNPSPSPHSTPISVGTMLGKQGAPSGQQKSGGSWLWTAG